ncbi:MAG: hypothetical protein WAW37_01520 [Syntrophobacteraceae bacterium]
MRERISLGDILLILAATIVALLVHGYHSGIEDEAIYLPSIKKILNPSLYPHDSAFFLAQTKFTLFDKLIALPVSVIGVPVSFVLFGTHILTIFMVLLGCLQMSRLCFQDHYAHWGSVALVGALLTIPVTGTALYIMDQHLHPRSLSTVAVLFALIFALEKRYAPAVLCFIAGALIHAQMTFYGLMLTAFLVVRPPRHASLAVAAAPNFLNGVTPDEIWMQISVTRTHHYPLRWPWYEWLGVVGPLVLLLWFSALLKNGSSFFSHLCRRTAIFGALATLAAVTLTATPQLQRLANLQPMRSFQLIYLLFFLLAGGLIGRWILKDKPLRWVILFLPLCLGMFAAQRAEFPAGSHIEWPGTVSKNPWLQAFEWVRLNTPNDAYFALDPHYMKNPGEDFHGFRGLAERSMMSDYVKDIAVVALSATAGTIGADNGSAPSSLPVTWVEHMKALRGWKDFKLDDFRRLKDRFGVTWVVLEKPGHDDMPCQYENERLKVCLIP